MDLRQLINVNLAALGIAASLLVGLGQANLLMPAGVMLAAAAALWYCDHLERFALDRWIINAVVFLMAALAAVRFTQVGGAPDAVIAADGLMVLLAALFFERKSMRTWWDLFSLSLLLVFLSCALYQGPLFAVVLAVYFFFALTGLALISLYRQQQASRTGVAGGLGEVLVREEGRIDWWRLAGLAVATLLVGPLSLYLRFRPLPERRFAISPADRPDRAGGEELVALPSVELPGGRRHGPAVPNREFWWRMGRLTLAGLLIGAIVFGSTPRFGGVEMFLLRGQGRGWEATSATLQRTVGFDDQVQLGELGPVLENTQRVLAIRLLQHRSGQPYPVRGSLFLRGAVLNHYSDGRWAFRATGAAMPAPLLTTDRQDTPPAVVRQEIRLDPLDRSELFCVWPSYALGLDDRVQFDGVQERLLRPGSLRRRTFAYELATTAFVNGVQADLVPATGPVDIPQLLQWPAAALPRLAELAEQWAREADLPASDVAGRARALERQLRQSPRFRYRLGDYERSSELDPIEDFIVNDPRGHCEHFATALTLMLRSQGLPARMVVGYKTDEYNYLEERYWARQSHAHTWVEAYLPAAAIPQELRRRDGLSDWSHGAWLRLDATPSDLDELSLIEYVKHTYRSWQAAVRTVWTQHVMQMSGSRQDLLIYRPLIQQARQALGRLGDGQWWWGGEPMGFGEALASPWRLIRSPLLLAVGFVLVGGLLVGLIATRRRSAGRAAAVVRPGRRGRVQGSPTAEFYRRWEAALERRGLHRAPAQTPREFAREAGRELAEAVDQPQLGDAALRVIEAFYEVRFGGARLDAQRTALLEDDLARIQRAARQKRNGRPPAARSNGSE